MNSSGTQIAILPTFIRLLFVLPILEWPLKTCFTVMKADYAHSALFRVNAIAGLAIFKPSIFLKDSLLSMQTVKPEKTIPEV